MNATLFDLGILLPKFNNLIKECHQTKNNECLSELNTIFNDTWLKNISKEFRTSIERPCDEVERYSWMLEREYFVAIIMGLLACIGLLGNLLSCLIIIIHLLKFSGTFVLFIFLSIADSLVVIMQTIDAYRNSVAVDFYTILSPNDLYDSTTIWRRDWNCKLFLYFWHLGLQLSAWLVMALSVDRYASLKHLYMTHSRRFLYRRAWIIGGMILIFLAIINIPFLVYVKSVVYEMPCGLSHYCIFSDFFDKTGNENHNKLQSEQLFNPIANFIKTENYNNTNHTTTTTTNTNNTNNSINSLFNFSEMNNDLFDTKQISSRRISIWLSRQHLIVFGIIPYTITFIFNLLLIHYLRTLPWPQVTQSSSTRIGINSDEKNILNKCEKKNFFCKKIFNYLFFDQNYNKNRNIDQIKNNNNNNNIQNNLNINFKQNQNMNNDLFHQIEIEKMKNKFNENILCIDSVCSYPLSNYGKYNQLYNLNNSYYNQYRCTKNCLFISHLLPHTWDGTIHKIPGNGISSSCVLLNEKINTQLTEPSSLSLPDNKNNDIDDCTNINNNNNNNSNEKINNYLSNTQCFKSDICCTPRVLFSCALNNPINDSNGQNSIGCCKNMKYFKSNPVETNNNNNINSVHNFHNYIHHSDNSLKGHLIITRKRRSSSSGSGWFVGQTRTTILLLAVTFTFIGLTLPYLIYVELKQFNVVDFTRAENYRPAHMIEELCRFLFFINNSLNFLIYMTGRQFRKGFHRLLNSFRLYLRKIFCKSKIHQNRWYAHPPNQNYGMNKIKLNNKLKQNRKYLLPTLQYQYQHGQQFHNICIQNCPNFSQETHEHLNSMQCYAGI